MKIVIIEDETLTAGDLAETIKKVEPAAEIVATLSSVKEATAYLRENDEPDLIFSDIQLGDGLSFKIFEAAELTVPVIFCTAYDEYALSAFKAMGIEYILKPFTAQAIGKALGKYHELKNRLGKSDKSTYSTLAGHMTAPKNNCILVNYKGKILPLKLEHIAIFYIHNEMTHLLTFGKEQYFISKTLEEIESIMPSSFYRASRQHIINREAIKDISQYFGRKLLLNLTVPFDEKVTVSKAKSSHFLAWLSGTRA